MKYVPNMATKSPRPDSQVILTHSKALQAAQELQKYVEGPDTTYASNFTVMLCVFRQETHTLGMEKMEEMKITSYFTLRPQN